MTQIFSSDDTEFIRRFLAAAITHGISQMRPVRSLQIPPEVGKSPTDFTDIHRFFLGCFLSHADFADDADFFHHRMTRNLAEATCSVVSDTPWDRIKRFTRDSIKNLCISVKSVGQNNPTKKNLCISVKSVGQNPPTKKNLRHLRNLRDQKQ